MTNTHMTFTELLPEIKATYREQPRAFHVLATRYYIGAESMESLRAQGKPQHVRDFCTAPPLTTDQVNAIINNR